MEEDTDRKISRSEFTNAISVAEEKVEKDIVKLKKSLEKDKITRKEYADKRMNRVREFVELRRELQEMISDDIQDSFDNDDDEALPSKKVVNVEEENTIKDEV